MKSFIIYKSTKKHF